MNQLLKHMNLGRPYLFKPPHPLKDYFTGPLIPNWQSLTITTVKYSLEVTHQCKWYSFVRSLYIWTVLRWFCSSVWVWSSCYITFLALCYLSLSIHILFVSFTYSRSIPSHYVGIILPSHYSPLPLSFETGFHYCHPVCPGTHSIETRSQTHRGMLTSASSCWN